MKFTYYGKQVDIRLDTGLYRLDNLSGNGKSFLCKILNEKFSDKPNEVLAVTLDGVDTEFKRRYVLDVLNRCRPKIVMFDRYDMYSDFAREEIIKLMNDSTIILDTKHIDEICDIEIEPAFLHYDGRTLLLI